jgi:hypothetical protein
VSCHGFFHVGHKEFGNLLIRDCTIAVNVYTTEYYSTIKKNKMMSFAGKWSTLEIIMLSKNKPSSKSQKSPIFAHMWNLYIK